MSKLTKERGAICSAACETCGASVGELCMSLNDPTAAIKHVHGARYFAAYPDERHPRRASILNDAEFWERVAKDLGGETGIAGVLGGAFDAAPPKSRSELRRQAIQRGEEPPTFESAPPAPHPDGLPEFKLPDTFTERAIRAALKHTEMFDWNVTLTAFEAAAIRAEYEKRNPGVGAAQPPRER